MQQAAANCSELILRQYKRSFDTYCRSYDEESLLPLLSPIQGTPMHAGAAAEPPGGAQLPRSLRVADLNRQLRAGFIRKVRYCKVNWMHCGVSPLYSMNVPYAAARDSL